MYTVYANDVKKKLKHVNIVLYINCWESSKEFRLNDQKLN